MSFISVAYIGNCGLLANYTPVSTRGHQRCRRNHLSDNQPTRSESGLPLCELNFGFLRLMPRQVTSFNHRA